MPDPLIDSAVQIAAKSLTRAPPTARAPRTFGNYEIFRREKGLAPRSQHGSLDPLSVRNLPARMKGPQSRPPANKRDRL